MSTRIHDKRKLDYDPEPTECKSLIINTLIQAQNTGKADNTVKAISYSLKQISKRADLRDPEQVKTYIASLEVSNATKIKLCFAYDYFCKVNQIGWTKPRYKWERKIPLIPTTQNIDKIIATSTRKFATIFTILKETGLEACELARMKRTDIDTERGIINAQGCKGHNSRSFKLKEQTADMLRTYMQTHKGSKPFPSSKTMGDQWRRKRNELSETLNDPQIKTASMRNLRHYYATRLYDKTKDILLVKQRLGHKKIETTMFYTQLITFNEEEEYTCKTASNIKEAKELIENGFTYVTEMDGIKLFKKRK